MPSLQMEPLVKLLGSNLAKHKLDECIAVALDFEATVLPNDKGEGSMLEVRVNPPTELV